MELLSWIKHYQSFHFHGSQESLLKKLFFLHFSFFLIIWYLFCFYEYNNLKNSHLQLRFREKKTSFQSCFSEIISQKKKKKKLIVLKEDIGFGGSKRECTRVLFFIRDYLYFTWSCSAIEGMIYWLKIMETSIYMCVCVFKVNL